MWAPHPRQMPALELRKERRRARLQHLGERRQAECGEAVVAKGVRAGVCGKAAAFPGIWVVHPARFAGGDTEASEVEGLPKVTAGKGGTRLRLRSSVGLPPRGLCAPARLQSQLGPKHWRGLIAWGQMLNKQTKNAHKCITTNCVLRKCQLLY